MSGIKPFSPFKKVGPDISPKVSTDNFVLPSGDLEVTVGDTYLLGGQIVHKTDAGAADYNPSALTSDYIITVDTTAAARAVIISTEDRDTGSADNVRVFKIKDIAGNASVNNITVSLETAGNIEFAANYVINVDGGSITIGIDGTNGYIL